MEFGILKVGDSTILNNIDKRERHYIKWNESGTERPVKMISLCEKQSVVYGLQNTKPEIRRDARKLVKE